MVCKIHKAEKTSKVIDNIAKKYGHEVLSLPPYHCDLSAIQFILANEKNFVARENNKMTLQSVETLLRKRREEITAEICKYYVEHVKQVENFCWKTDRIIYKKWTNWKLIWIIQMKTRVTWRQTVMMMHDYCSITTE